ncbi:MAG: hypothetical protein HY735_25355 [Verrucomicrobia bacterium]|nr:hypothetical protein [Verrucomicrobiota bacterium]
MNPKHFHVQTPEGSFTWIGGSIEPAGNGDVWLCNPGGERVLKASAKCVRESSREETARRILEDRRAAKAPMN